MLRDTPAHWPSQLSAVSVMTDIFYINKTLSHAGLFPGTWSCAIKDADPGDPRTLSKCSVGVLGHLQRSNRREPWHRYHGGRRLPSNSSFHSPTVIPPLALDTPSIMKHYHQRRAGSHTSPHHSPTMVTLHDTRFVEYRWRYDGWIVKTVVTQRSSAYMIPAPDFMKWIS